MSRIQCQWQNIPVLNIWPEPKLTNLSNLTTLLSVSDRRPRLCSRFCLWRSWNASQLSQCHLVHVQWRRCSFLGNLTLASTRLWFLCILSVLRFCICVTSNLILLLGLLDVLRKLVLDLQAVDSGFRFAPAHLAIWRIVYPWLPDHLSITNTEDVIM